MTVSHAKIRIHSVIDDASMDFEYTGEYAFKDNTHLIVYTDYTGNDITKCAIQANAFSDAGKCLGIRTFRHFRNL